MCDCLVGLRLVLTRVCLSCWVEVGFIMCVFVLLSEVSFIMCVFVLLSEGSFIMFVIVLLG